MSFIFGFLRSKLSNIFVVLTLGVVTLLLLIFLFNSDTILSKFGFETKTTLKGQVVATQKELDKAILANESLESVGKIEKAVAETTVKELSDNFEKKVLVEEKIKTSRAKRDAVISQANKRLVQEKPVTDSVSSSDLSTAKTPQAEISEANITHLTDVYETLFETERNSS